MSKFTFIFTIFLFFLLTTGVAQKTLIIYTIDTRQVVGPNTRFWQALGHDYLFFLVNQPEGRALLDRMEENNSCRYFRTHYTFSTSTGRDKSAGASICGQVLTFDEQGRPVYDFSRVNRTFREYVKRGMKPIVEFDFFPDGVARDFDAGPNDESFATKEGEPLDWNAWETLLRKFMQNLVDTFGKEELRSWYFEVWNEPDGWDRQYLIVFSRLYDVFASVVKSYDPQFKVGGPACYHIYFLRDFLDHVINGKNQVTGETGSPLDFISYHIYGISGAWLNQSPRIVPQVERFVIELLWIQRLLEKYHLKNVEFHLNEWGQSSHYARSSREHPDLVYRDDERAALFMVKLVDNLLALQDSHHFETSLLGYWGFCFEAKQDELFLGNRELTTAGNVPKPILTAYEMLARLGGKRLKITGPRAGDRTGVLATRSGEKEFQFLVYNFGETDDDVTVSDSLEVTLLTPTGSTIQLDEIILDQTHHNTYRKWEKLGRPKKINPNIRNILVDESHLQPDAHLLLPVTNNAATLKLSLPRHSMRLYSGRIQ